MSKRALSFLSLCLAAACLAAEAPAPAPAFPKKKSPVTFDAIKAEAKKSKKDLTRLVGKYLTTTFKAEELRQASGGAIKMEEVASKADLRSGKPEVLLVFHYLMFEEGNQLADAGGQERRRGWGARRGRQDDGAAPEAPAADKKR